MALQRTPSGFAASQRYARGLGPAFAQELSIEINKLLKQALQKGILQAEDSFNDQRQVFFSAFEQYKSGRGGSRSLATANAELAKRAQEAVIASYDERVVAHEKLAPYRVGGADGGNRFSGGALRRALAHPDMFVGTYQGIAYMNISVLDQEAKHWARLNYGAGPEATQGPAPRDAHIQLFGQYLGVIKATTPFTSAGFKMPPGVWVGSGAGNGFEGAKWRSRPPGFYPTAKRPLRFPPGRVLSIHGQRFFDAAGVSIAKNLSDVYADLIHEWTAQASASVPKGLIHKAVTAGTLVFE